MFAAPAGSLDKVYQVRGFVNALVYQVARVYNAPMAEELRTERVTTMMAPSEVKAIDDWSFQQRIRSRGEAIRRLIELGLAAAQQPQAGEPPVPEHSN